MKPALPQSEDIPQQAITPKDYFFRSLRFDGSKLRQQRVHAECIEVCWRCVLAELEALACTARTAESRRPGMVVRRARVSAAVGNYLTGGPPPNNRACMHARTQALPNDSFVQHGRESLVTAATATVREEVVRTCHGRLLWLSIMTWCVRS